MTIEVKFENVLLAVGYDESESRIISVFITGESFSANDIMNKTGLSRGKVYDVLGVLVKKYVLYKDIERGGYYTINESFLNEVKLKLNTMVSVIVPSIEKVQNRSRSRDFNDIMEICVELGYKIVPVKYDEKRSESFYGRYRIFDYIIKGDFNYCLSFIDQSKENTIKMLLERKQLNPLINETRSLNCVSGIIIFDNKFKFTNRFIDEFKNKSKRYMRSNIFIRGRYGSMHYGIKNKEFLILNNTDDIKEELLEFFKEIQNMSNVIEQRINVMGEKIEDIENTILNCEVLFRNLRNPRYLGLNPSESGTKSNRNKMIRQLMIIINRIVNREKRNLDIIKSEFRKNYVEINSHIESTWSKLYIPSHNTLNNYDKILDELRYKFNAVHHEITSLLSNVINYSFSEDSFNPFIITIPFEPTEYYIENQNNAKNELSNFIQSVQTTNDTIIKFIAAEPGMGKSHIIQNFVKLHAENNKIIPIIINCTYKNDIYKNIMPKISDEKEYPDNIKQYILPIDTDISVHNMKTLTLYLQDIFSIIKSAKYDGLLIILDEFENLLRPFLTIDVDRLGIEPPIIKQLKELFNVGIPNLGIIISCRKNSCTLIEKHFGLRNFYEFVTPLETLNITSIQKIILHRYKVWNTKNIRFSKNVLLKILTITNGNARDTIKYLRELFSIASRKNKQRIDVRDLRDLSPIPLLKV